MLWHLPQHRNLGGREPAGHDDQHDDQHETDGLTHLDLLSRDREPLALHVPVNPEPREGVGPSPYCARKP